MKWTCDDEMDYYDEVESFDDKMSWYVKKFVAVMLMCKSFEWKLSLVHIDEILDSPADRRTKLAVRRAGGGLMVSLTKLVLETLAQVGMPADRRPHLAVRRALFLRKIFS
jgi:hypothetical protein